MCYEWMTECVLTYIHLLNLIHIHRYKMIFQLPTTICVEVTSEFKYLFTFFLQYLKESLL